MTRPPEGRDEQVEPERAGVSRGAVSWRRGWRGLAIAVLGATTLGITVLAYQGDAGNIPEGPAVAPAVGAALTVTTVRPVSVLWPESLAVNGAISAWQEASVSSLVSGARLVDVLVDVGDEVEDGQLLARFDAAPLEAEYAQQQAAVAEAEARLEEADANASRALRLRETQAISEFDLIKASAALHGAQAQVELAKARLESQRLALGHTRVTAPDAGVITRRSAMLGAVAAPGVELFRLVRQNRLEWHAEITAANVGAVQPGQSVELQLVGGGSVSGTVRQIAPVVEADTRTAIAYVALDPAATGVRVGMYASGKVLLGQRVGIALPASAIVERDGYEYVFRLDTDDDPRAMQVKVTSGRRLDGHVEVLEGVSPGDDVVSSGGEFLSDGDRVRVAPTSTARHGQAGTGS
jgi:RND family efflux transporter MFP subunit